MSHYLYTFTKSINQFFISENFYISKNELIISNSVIHKLSIQYKNNILETFIYVKFTHSKLFMFIYIYIFTYKLLNNYINNY